MRSDQRQSRWLQQFRCWGLPMLLLALSGTFLVADPKLHNTAASVVPFDVIHYDVQVEPDILTKTITGRVLVRLIVRANQLTSVDLDCGELTIDAVRENGQGQKFERRDHRLSVALSRPAKAREQRILEIQYHGSP